MQEDNDEEDGVEVGDDGSRADDGAPGERHSPVGDVVGFARVGPEATGQETVPKQRTSSSEYEWVYTCVEDQRTHEQSG